MENMMLKKLRGNIYNVVCINSWNIYFNGDKDDE